MKKYIYYIVLGLLITLTGTTIKGCIDSKKYEANWKSAATEVKAYIADNDSLHNVSILHEITANQYRLTNDTLVEKLREVQKELKIKDKNLVSISRLASHSERVDSIFIPGDTIFRDPELHIDTTIVDPWYKLNVQLAYPSLVVVSPQIISDKYIVTSTKKETINPPKKFWLARLFQKKHKVVYVEVVEKNPYIITDNNKFIQIVK